MEKRIEIACRDCELGDQPSTTSRTPRQQFILSTQQKALLAPEEHDPKELHRQGGRVEEWWQEEVADYVDTMTPAMKKVLAKTDQETDVKDDLWRHAWETKYGKVMEDHTTF